MVKIWTIISISLGESGQNQGFAEGGANLYVKLGAQPSRNYAWVFEYFGYFVLIALKSHVP